MSTPSKDPLLQVETTCGSLLYELKIIWDEVGESDAERDKMLLELERECLEVYRRKVDVANKCRAQLRQAIADSEAELAAICSAMGERPVHIRQSDQTPGSLKAELSAILPELEEMKKRNSDRKNQFLEVLKQIEKIQTEIYTTSSTIVLDETDLSLRKLEELHAKLQTLQKEKSDRLKQVLEHLNCLNSLCLVMGIDFKQTVHEVHPSLSQTEATKSISDDTISRLATAIKGLLEVKIQRMQRIQDLATSLIELWNLMDTPIEEQQMFQSVTCKIAASEQEISEPNMLSLDLINYVEAEVTRLESLKSSKMKEIVFKKRSELEAICRKTHILPESDTSLEVAIEAIESGAVDAGSLLEQIEILIGKVKEEAFSRKEILEKVEKWMGACDEECWLEEYNRDVNRYNAGRGAHLTLKRAEKARALVNKLPGMVEALAMKTVAWENENGVEFTYDGVITCFYWALLDVTNWAGHITDQTQTLVVRLLSMLEDYKILRQQKEEERKRKRDQKKLEGQLIAEQEALFGSKPSPIKQQSGKKGARLSMGGASSRRLSLGGSAAHATPKPDVQSMRAASSMRSAKKIDRNKDDGFGSQFTGRRILDTAGNKKHNPSELERRKPFSPISSKEVKMTEGDIKHEMLQNTFQNNMTSFMTPSKPTVTDEENRNPQKNIIPILPFSPSAQMQTAMTPAVKPMIPEEEEKEAVEYSFEERRAGFFLPRSHLKTTV